MSNRSREYPEDCQPFTLSISSSRPDAYKGGDIVKVQRGSGLGIGEVEKWTRWCLELVRLTPPIVEGDRVIQYQINVLEVDEGNHVLKVDQAWHVHGGEVEAKKLLAKMQKQMEAAQMKQASKFMPLASLPPTEADAQKGQWSTLGELWPETVRTILEGKAANTEFAAETYLNTGEITNADKKTVDLTHKLKNRTRKMTAVKRELSCGWIEKGYRYLGSKELAVAVEKATGFRITPKGIMSIRNRLDLGSIVSPGPKPRTP